jgi:hypothetical protein
MTAERLYYLCRVEAAKVDILTEPWERALYASALFNAKVWGYKKTKEYKEYYTKNHLIDKYNV